MTASTLIERASSLLGRPRFQMPLVANANRTLTTVGHVCNALTSTTSFTRALRATITFLKRLTPQRFPHLRPDSRVSRIRIAYGNSTSRTNGDSDNSPNNRSDKRTRSASTTPLRRINQRTPLRSIVLTAFSVVTVIAPILLPHNTLADSNDDLVCPLREDWEDHQEDCPCEKDWTPTAEQVKKMVADHMEWANTPPRPDFNVPGRAIFCNSIFPVTDFSEKILAHADFRNADLYTNNLRLQDRGDHQQLLGIDYTGADLRGADFSGAAISAGIFYRANVSDANFENAYLYFADFSKSKMNDTKLSGATFAYVSLADTEFAPLSLPEATELGSIEGLVDVRFPKDKPASLVKLRAMLRKSGLRQKEREVTYAINSTHVEYLLESCPPEKWFMRPSLSYQKPCSQKDWLHGAVQTVLFDWTTKWGLHPFRAIWIMIVIACCLTPLYVCCTWVRGRCCSQATGVFRIWPTERLDVGREGIAVVEERRVERVSVKFPYAIMWGIYFAILSAFHIGWRDVNVASLITKLQFREYFLRSHGWIRSVSGTQSLFSVFLVALWVLTYFGRPFES